MIPAVGQTEELDNVEYTVHSGNKDVTLPVISHLDGFTIAQKLDSGVLTKSDGSITYIASEDLVALATHGVTILVDSESETAELKIDNTDKAYYGANLMLTIKNTLQEEDDFSNTTKVKILFVRITCHVTKEFLAS